MCKSFEWALVMLYLERRHVVAVVVDDLARDGRNSALDLGLSEEAHDADHGETSVVDLVGKGR